MTDPNVNIEYVASRMWYDYCVRVSGKQYAETQRWDDVDTETSRIYLNHALSAIRAISEISQMNTFSKIVISQ